MTRQVVLDTETTGLEVKDNERVIEIGCVELMDGKEGSYFHTYLNPERDISEEATAVHGMTSESLREQPLFGEVAEDFAEFLNGAELVAHNAPFDVGFINAEFERVGSAHRIESLCPVVHDTLLIARKQHPGAAASLNALCSRYRVDLNVREKHGALIDARLLVEVWLHMNGRQSKFDFNASNVLNDTTNLATTTVTSDNKTAVPLRVILAGPEELRSHESYLATEGINFIWNTADEQKESVSEEGVDSEHSDKANSQSVGQGQPQHTEI